MEPAKKKAPAKKAQSASTDVASVVAWMERTGAKKVRDGMARYAIPSDRAFGIPVGVLRAQAKKLGKSHALAAALWSAEHYEARMLACFVDDPKVVTAAQMDRWCRDFDNWAICDTACFHLFDRTPHAFEKVRAWADERGEFQKRAAFALLASVALHDKSSGDEPFLRCLPLIEQAATDDRNFVKKAVNWALRGIGGRKSPPLKTAALTVARRLAESPDATARWVGKDALRQLDKRARPRKG